MRRWPPVHRQRNALTVTLTYLRINRVQADYRRPPATFPETISAVVALHFYATARITLPAREFSLLKALAGHPGQVLSRQELLSLAWGMNFDPGTNLVNVYAGYLRRKLSETVIDTIRGQVTFYRPTTRNPARNELNPRVRFGHHRLFFRCVIQGHGDQAGWRALGGSARVYQDLHGSTESNVRPGRPWGPIADYLQRSALGRRFDLKHRSSCSGYHQQPAPA